MDIEKIAILAIAICIMFGTLLSTFENNSENEVRKEAIKSGLQEQMVNNHIIFVARTNSPTIETK